MGTLFLTIFSIKFIQKSAFFLRKLKTPNIFYEKTQELCSKTQGFCQKLKVLELLDPVEFQSDVQKKSLL